MPIFLQTKKTGKDHSMTKTFKAKKSSILVRSSMPRTGRTRKASGGKCGLVYGTVRAHK